MTFNTGKPVPSTDPRDLYDNAENLDKLVNGADPFYADRKGKLRESWSGMENSFTNAQDGRENTFTLSQADKESRFQAFLVSSGYVSKGDYAANVVLAERNEYVAVSATTTGATAGFYRPGPNATLPLTLTGVWATDEPLLRLLGDDVLRQELSSPTGSERVGRGGLTLSEELSKGFPLPADPPTDLFIIYGQSNSVGWAQNTPGYPAVITDWAKAFDPTNGTLTPLPKGLISSAGQVSTGHGWAEFVNEYVRLTGRKCVIMSCGLGGQSLASLSKPGTIYSQMATAVASCKATIASAGLSLGKVYSIFNQGEQDLKIGTSKWSYKLSLVTLVNDMKADFQLDAFFFQLVGSPRVGFGNEGQLSNIQLSQKEICIEQSNTYLASEAAASFTTGSGLMQGADGVHYTQQGYNLLGRETARAVADVVRGVNTRTKESVAQYGSILAGARRRWNSVYARIRKESGGFVLLDEAASSGAYALGFVDTIETTGSDVKLGMTTNNFVIAGESASVTHLQSARNGLMPVFIKTTIDAPTAKTGLLVTFNARISFLVSAAGAIRSMRNIPSTNAFISGNVSASVSGSNVTLSFPGLEMLPSVSTYGTGSAIVTSDSIGPPATITINFSSPSALAIVSAEVIGVNPNTIINGCEFGVWLLAANIGE